MQFFKGNFCIFVKKNENLTAVLFWGKNEKCMHDNY